MPEFVLIDEIHLSFLVPAGLPDDSARAVAVALAAEDFLARLTAAVRVVFRADPVLDHVHVTLTR